MTTINRAQVLWTGFPGAPGFSNFYGVGLAASTDALQAFFSGLMHLFPPAVTISVPAAGDSFDDATGEVVGTWTTGSVHTDLHGTNSGHYSAASGAVVNWRTNGINRGRHVRGRTFLVPIGASNLSDAGGILPSTVDELQTAANTLVAAMSPDLMIWSRPRLKVGGAAFPIVTAHVPGMAAVLRSRRD